MRLILSAALVANSATAPAPKMTTSVGFTPDIPPIMRPCPPFTLLKYSAAINTELLPCNFAHCSNYWKASGIVFDVIVGYGRNSSFQSVFSENPLAELVTASAEINVCPCCINSNSSGDSGSTFKNNVGLIIPLWYRRQFEPQLHCSRCQRNSPSPLLLIQLTPRVRCLPRSSTSCGTKWNPALL